MEALKKMRKISLRRASCTAISMRTISIIWGWKLVVYLTGIMEELSVLFLCSSCLGLLWGFQLNLTADYNLTMANQPAPQETEPSPHCCSCFQSLLPRVSWACSPGYVFAGQSSCCLQLGLSGSFMELIAGVPWKGWLFSQLPKCSICPKDSWPWSQCRRPTYDAGSFL